jgi:hypothetical protein
MSLVMTPAARLSNAAILAAWEAGQAGSPLDRANAVLGYAVPEAERAGLDAWTMGRRDARLLDVYAATFGDEIAGLVACPECGEQLEIALAPDGIRSPYGSAEQEFELLETESGYHLIFRLPTGADLRAGAVYESEGMARRALLERCVVRAERAGVVIPVADLPEPLIVRLGEAMAEHDTQSDVRLDLACPACTHTWQARFDISDFVWREVVARVRRLIADIHTLALAYGWREADILALSDARRNLYLEQLLR